MILALIDGKLVEATETGPKRARCPFCGEWVEASHAPMTIRVAWYHLTDYAAAECEKIKYGIFTGDGVKK